MSKIYAKDVRTTGKGNVVSFPKIASDNLFANEKKKGNKMGREKQNAYI